MGASRPGKWNLLGHDSDPVPADPTALDTVIAHYKKVADAMTTQAALLKRIGDGDESQFKGESANAMRKRARESADALGSAAGRYASVRDALVTYQPALRTARSETALALGEAETAEREQQTAEGMPHPAAGERPADQPVTAAEQQASDDRNTAVRRATGNLQAAKDRSDRALRALDEAATAAAATIRQHWGSDGLNHSWHEANMARFNKFLKKLVEVLSWIGAALAVLALFIPGVGALAVAALVVAGIGLVGSIVLAAQGEDSWMNVILGALAVFTFGVGALAVKAAKIGVSLKNVVNLAGRLKPVWKIGPNGVATLGLKFTGPLTKVSWATVFGKISPGSWAIFKNPLKWWSGHQVIGLPSAQAIYSVSIFNVLRPGAAGVVMPWLYLAGPVNFAFGNIAAIWGLTVPQSSLFKDSDPRGDWSWWTDYDLNHLTTGAGESIT